MLLGFLVILQPLVWRVPAAGTGVVADEHRTAPLVFDAPSGDRLYGSGLELLWRVAVFATTTVEDDDVIADRSRASATAQSTE